MLTCECDVKGTKEQYITKTTGVYIKIIIREHFCRICKLSLLWREPNVITDAVNQPSTTRIEEILSCRSPSEPAGVSPPPGLERGGRARRRLDVLQVAGVAEQVAVQRVAAVALLVVQLHLTVLSDTDQWQRWRLPLGDAESSACLSARKVQSHIGWLILFW